MVNIVIHRSQQDEERKKLGIQQGEMAELANRMCQGEREGISLPLQ